MKFALVEADLLDQPVDVIVNAWNQNIIPWWLLLPQGVSGVIKGRDGAVQGTPQIRANPVGRDGAFRNKAARERAAAD